MRPAPPAVRAVGLAVVVGLVVLALSLGPGQGAARDRPSVVALGDSVATATACSCSPFPVLVARALGAGPRVHDLALDGQTTVGLLGQLASPSVRSALAGATDVTVTVGANDFDESLADSPGCRDPEACFAVPLRHLGPTLGAVLRQVSRLAPHSAAVVVTGYWNVFRDGDVGATHGQSYVTGTRALTARVNSVLAAAAASASASFVDLDAAFTRAGDLTALLAEDGDHPDARGHRVIAAAVVRALQQRPAAT